MYPCASVLLGQEWSRHCQVVTGILKNIGLYQTIQDMKSRNGLCGLKSIVFVLPQWLWTFDGQQSSLEYSRALYALRVIKRHNTFSHDIFFVIGLSFVFSGKSKRSSWEMWAAETQYRTNFHFEQQLSKYLANLMIRKQKYICIFICRG